MQDKIINKLALQIAQLTYEKAELLVFNEDLTVKLKQLENIIKELEEKGK